MHLVRRVAGPLAGRIRLSSRSANPSSAVTAIDVSAISQSGRNIPSGKFCFGRSSWWSNENHSLLWIIAAGQAVFIGMNDNPVLADASIQNNSKTELEAAETTALQKIDDGSVVSNIHTSKWRVFTDNGRDFFLQASISSFLLFYVVSILSAVMIRGSWETLCVFSSQGKLDNAETLFLSALKEAKEGFGEKDPHVASACNNLAELYRVKKEFSRAEPLYLEAIKILEESFGPEDIRVGAALHNMGQFYLAQRKWEEASKCYEIKGRVLGFNNPDYADTMYHLGTVIYLMGKQADAEVLIQDSIRITEEAGQGESITCVRRLRYLAQIYSRSNRLVEAENVHRKVLHIMELSKGWKSMDTLMAAQGLVQTLLSAGKFGDAQELLERCLETQKSLLPEDHIQNASTMTQLAKAVLQNFDTLRNKNLSEAVGELDKAKDILIKSMRISQKALDRLRKQTGSRKKHGVAEGTRREGRVALATLDDKLMFFMQLQSLYTLGLLEIKKHELQEKEKCSSAAEDALFQCILVYKEFEAEKLISDFPEVKTMYLSCLKQLSSLVRSNAVNQIVKISTSAAVEELNDEIKRVEAEISRHKSSKP
ncbi:unnamed protein product [Linum tenue]|uniref:Uncharacterized protein n=1 Tax=Linum tenue TaxID=586396 RepID=A0AAV0S1T3_9ROSI|nr:unnamed protein product [Linum tenue]